jgi:hypothetical protein
MLPLCVQVELDLVRQEPLDGRISFASLKAGRDGKYISGSDKMSVERIVIELETPDDSRSLFRLRLDNKVVGENLTAVQAHLLVGEILDRITLPRPSAMN